MKLVFLMPLKAILRKKVLNAFQDVILDKQHATTSKSQNQLIKTQTSVASMWKKIYVFILENILY